MPYVNIKITKEGATPGQKARLIRGVTQLLAEVLGMNPQTTVVVIDEVETDNWGVGGETVTATRPLSEAAGEETPKKRGLPEALIQYREKKKRERAETTEDDEGGVGKQKQPSKKGGKKKSEV